MEAIFYNFKKYKQADVFNGILLKKGTAWAFFKDNPNDYRLDGFRFANIRHISVMNSRIGSTTERIFTLKYNSEQDKEFANSFNLDNDFALFNFLYEKQYLIIIGTSSEKTHKICRIKSLDEKSALLDIYDIYMNLKKTQRQKFSEIRYIELENDYLQSLHLVEEYKLMNRKPNIFIPNKSLGGFMISENINSYPNIRYALYEYSNNKVIYTLHDYDLIAFTNKDGVIMAINADTDCYWNDENIIGMRYCDFLKKYELEPTKPQGSTAYDKINKRTKKTVAYTFINPAMHITTHKERIVSVVITSNQNKQEQ